MVDLAFRDAFIRAAQAEAENEKYTPQLRGYISKTVYELQSRSII